MPAKTKTLGLTKSGSPWVCCAKHSSAGFQPTLSQNKTASHAVNRLRWN